MQLKLESLMILLKEQIKDVNASISSSTPSQLTPVASISPMKGEDHFHRGSVYPTKVAGPPGQITHTVPMAETTSEPAKRALLFTMDSITSCE